MSKFDDLKGFVDGLERDFQEFYDKGNKAAGTRVRKAMQELKQKAQDIRTEVQNRKNEAGG
jgi:flagellar biosynthesis/type III secretory pathway protein FliH